MTSPLSVAEIVEAAYLPSLIRNTRLMAVPGPLGLASMVMSGCPSPLISPLMVMPPVVISSSPLVRDSVPPERLAANVIVSWALLLPLASARASRSESWPSFGSMVSSSVVTTKFAIGFSPSLTVVRPLSWLCREYARAYRKARLEDPADSVVHCALKAARGVRSVLQKERAKRRCVASATRDAAAWRQLSGRHRLTLSRLGGSPPLLVFLSWLLFEQLFLGGRATTHVYVQC